jgi:hypothetical protein
VFKRVVSEAAETVSDLSGWAHFAWVLGGGFRGFASRMAEYGVHAKNHVLRSVGQEAPPCEDCSRWECGK